MSSLWKSPTRASRSGLAKTTGWIAGLVLLGASLSAVAQDKKPPAPEELDFEGDVVETSFLKPDASLVEGEARKGGASLLKIRRDFVPEIVRSAEDI